MREPQQEGNGSQVIQLGYCNPSLASICDVNPIRVEKVTPNESAFICRGDFDLPVGWTSCRPPHKHLQGYNSEGGGRDAAVIKLSCRPPVKYKPQASEQGKWRRRVKSAAAILMWPCWQWWEGSTPHAHLPAASPSDLSGHGSMAAGKSCNFGAIRVAPAKELQRLPCSLANPPPPFFWFISLQAFRQTARSLITTLSFPRGQRNVEDWPEELVFILSFL